MYLQFHHRNSAAMVTATAILTRIFQLMPTLNGETAEIGSTNEAKKIRYIISVSALLAITLPLLARTKDPTLHTVHLPTCTK